MKKILTTFLAGALLVFSQPTVFAIGENLPNDTDLDNLPNRVEDTEIIDNDANITEPDELIPPKVQLALEFDTEDPVQQEKVAEKILEFSEIFIEPKLDPEDLEQFQEVLNALTMKNNLMMGLYFENFLETGKADLYLALKNTNGLFTLILGLLETSCDLEIKTYESTRYYEVIPKEAVSEEDVAYLTKIGEVIFLTNTEAVMQETIDLSADTSKSIAYDSDFQKLKSNLAETYFALLYIDTEIISETSTTDIPLTALEVTDKTALALTLEEAGWYFTSYVLGNEAKIDELGLPFNLVDFTANLYQKFPADPAILYFETANLEGTLEAQLNALDTSAYASLVQAIEEATGLSFEQDFLSWWDQEFALGVQNTGTLIPALTMMVNAESNPESAAVIVNWIDTMINNLISSSAGTTDEELLSKDTVVINGNELNRFQIDLIPVILASAEPSNINILLEVLPPLELTYGLTGNNLFIFSTYPDLADHYGEDLSTEPYLAELMAKVPPENGGFSYLSLRNFFEYANNAIENFKLLFPGELDPYTLSTYYDFQGTLYLFEDLISTEINQTYEAGEKIFIKLREGDSTLPVTYEDIIEEEKNSDSDGDGRSDYEEAYIDYTNPYQADELAKVEFKDVSAEEWYAEDVNILANQGAVKGYVTEEGTYFNPNQPITRAEFTKIVLESFGYKIQSAPAPVFSDVHPQDWHYDYVYTAYSNGLVKGFPDHTFHPNEPVTRAEGLKIVLEAYGNFEQTAAPAPFADTKEHWANDYVNYGYQNGIVSGVNAQSFEPDRPITRAEASKIVNRVNELKLKHLEETSAPAEYTEDVMDMFVDTLF